MDGSRFGDRGQQFPGNPQVVICFLRSTGTDPLEKLLGHSGQIASRWRSVRFSVKYVDD